MRLLYLRLPEYGPLRDTALAFPRVDVLEDRAYALHFIVGVNGTGKSSALRALFRIFDCLSNGEWPNFDFELAYELKLRGESHPLTVFIANNEGKWALLHQNFQVPSGAEQWRRQFLALRNEPSRLGANDVINSNFIAEYFPAGILAYTSGLIDPWHDLRRPPLDRVDLDALRDSEPEPTERPVAWSPREELAFTATKSIGEEPTSDVALDQWHALFRKPSAADRGWRTRLMTPDDVRLAGLSVALKQAVNDLANLRDDASRRAKRQSLAAERKRQAAAQTPEEHDLRWLLTAAGLAWPTHIAFTFDRNARASWTGDTEQRLLLLYALADHVAPLPLGRERVVVSLHHRDTANVATQLGLILGEENFDALLHGNTALADLRDALGAPETGADALLRLLGGKDSNALDAFRTLAFWRDQCLLIEATATFRRIDEGPHESVVTYENLSDGEQQLLQRGGLLLLLKDAPNHLLLLDEPETHFNDRWKRELIDVIDDNLRTTRSHVVLTTHSSIVLSDAFRDEIIILTPEGVFHPSMPTFGADPSRILQHVFGSPDAIGQRAREELETWLNNSLDPTQREQLLNLLREIGAGYLRSKLWAKVEATEDVVPRS